MEQHRTRPSEYGPRRERPKPPLPSQAGRADGGSVRAAARRTGAVRRPPAAVRSAAGRSPARAAGAVAAGRAARGMPNPRLTGLGSGLFCGVLMVALGGLDQVLFGASLTVYGVLFLPVCVLTAVWVRRGDLLTAPVVVPIGFAAGLPAVSDDGLMGLVTALATQAGWLYGGTLVAGVTVIVRRIRLVNRRVARSPRLE
ncbi:DUF6542 domain-containing protein [Streptomyces sp. TRM68367]|uniref:DUF6542 domain-containing protein n=1 Tax=Streptomyces sp. TRM68367 TaxID=2758415 RepID=UPI00165AA5B2|nr:DUF6542 domain-containing protein [Streptomyces sp. TRM68367]MBC9723709.1 hypothetical protein [Streptomyces sp. TRM68367]